MLKLSLVLLAFLFSGSLHHFKYFYHYFYLLFLFLIKPHISDDLKINLWVLDPIFCKLHWDSRQLFFFFLLFLQCHLLLWSLPTEPSNTFSPSISFSLPPILPPPSFPSPLLPFSFPHDLYVLSTVFSGI